MSFLDIAIGLFLLLCLWGGYRKGFVLTLCGFLALFVALIGAFLCAKFLAPPVADIFTPALESAIQQALDESADAISVDILKEYPELIAEGLLPEGFELPEGLDLPEGFELPEGLKLSNLPIQTIPLDEITAYFGDLPVIQGLISSFRDAVEAGTIDATAHIAGALASFIALQVARIVIFILAFLLLQTAWFILSHTLNLAFKLPVLSTANALSGAALGLVKGLLIVCILIWLTKDVLLTFEAGSSSVLLPFFLSGPGQLISMIFQ